MTGVQGASESLESTVETAPDPAAPSGAVIGASDAPPPCRTSSPGALVGAIEAPPLVGPLLPAVPLGLHRPAAVRATPYEQRDLDVLGLRLRYIDVGPTEPGPPGVPLLLIHGHTSRIEEYDELVAHLSRHHRVLVCDLPGCGYSDKPVAQSYSLQLYEDVLLGFLDRLGVGEAFLAGGSLGGNLVLRLGHREPERFRRLVAWAPAGAWKPAPITGRIVRWLGGSALFWPVVWGQSRFWYEKSWPGRDAALRETFAYYREVSCRGFVRMYFEVAADQLEQSHFPYAHEIRQPTLLAWGDRDHGLNMGVGVKRLSETIPRARLEVFEGARHSLANEIPEALARVASDFLLAEDPPEPAAAG